MIPKLLCFAALALSFVLMCLFLVDLVLGMPFNGVSSTMDMGCALSAAIIFGFSIANLIQLR
ncbi:MAG: hypothetical protein ACRC10_08600 [Thermoguttaceae bacterium]